MIDVKFEKPDGEEYVFDLSIKDGDLETIDGYDNAIRMSLMCERRAAPSEIELIYKRGGWWGNLINGFQDSGYEYGSKLWLLYQSRLTQENLNKSINYSREGAQWFIDDNHITTIEVDGEIVHNSIILYLNFLKGNDSIATIAYDSWRQTFID